MQAEGKRDTRRLLLEAAAELISDAPGQDIPLRAICDKVGVKLPTLYHFFGSKEGLLDAVIDYGFDLYLAIKDGHSSTGDPIQDLRHGWDAHVDFGISQPGFYALMYGQVSPGRRPEAQGRPTRVLLGLTQLAAEQGRLVVSPENAADHILAANVGVTLALITTERPDLSLSASVREATIKAITGADVADESASGATDMATAAQQLLTTLGETTSPPLDGPELVLLRKWLTQISR